MPPGGAQCCKTAPQRRKNDLTLPATCPQNVRQSALRTASLFGRGHERHMRFDPPLTQQEVENAFAGSFQQIASIQVGGQGVVFKALTVTGAAAAAVALKIYHPDQLDERSAREVRALRAIQGETIVRLHEAGSRVIRGQKCPYVATSYVEGEVLSKVIERGPLGITHVARVGHDIALAIDLLWGPRIVHRDIKPSNIMMAVSGRAILIDLGLARHLSLTSLTTSGKTWGTEGYLSPEHAQAVKQLSCKSDVFALGIVMQECLLAHHPTNRRQAPLVDGGVSTTNLRAGLPENLVRLIDAMVSKRAFKRPSPSTIAQQLRPLLTSTS